MKTSASPPPVVVLEDDDDDQVLLWEAWKDLRFPNELVVLREAEQLFWHLGDRDGGCAVELPGLILLDWNLPRMSGVAVLARLQGHQEWRKIPVVVLTGHLPPEEKRQEWTRQTGVSWQQKPATQTAFHDALRTLRTRYLGG